MLDVQPLAPEDTNAGFAADYATNPQVTIHHAQFRTLPVRTNGSERFDGMNLSQVDGGLNRLRLLETDEGMRSDVFYLIKVGPNSNLTLVNEPKRVETGLSVGWDGTCDRCDLPKTDLKTEMKDGVADDHEPSSVARRPKIICLSRPAKVVKGK
ncbi:hypothetical protein CROQUDRAFT_89178 [Cronartium quercuum f. sp. fusiforme G11]|uniref:Uncharacterized protein n=1 Tax=Cronartium quercuum f. sp. fusiforme G11 TaxID=708437 RepID=A0A9P6TEZ1_9BASI|nr:hypothetical protein CROQUDRAFT_89178 [Cronartium quercuum f. sp. fusiforme G11]